MRKGSLPKRGSSSSTIPGIKPKVAVKTELAAKENVERKLRLLLISLKEAAAGGSREHLKKMPTTPRQFNLWEVKDGAKLIVHKNSRLTLLRYPDLKLSIEGVLKEIGQLVDFEGKPRSKADNLAASRRTSVLQKEMRLICERELVKARFQKDAAIEKLAIELDRYASLEKEFRRMLEELRTEISDLRIENRRLVQINSKIAGLRSL